MSVLRKIETESDMNRRISRHRILSVFEFVSMLIIVLTSMFESTQWLKYFALPFILIVGTVCLSHVLYFNALKDHLAKADESSMIGIAKDVCTYSDIKEEFCSVLKVRDFLTMQEILAFRTAVAARQEAETAEHKRQHVHDEWESVKGSICSGGEDC